MSLGKKLFKVVPAAGATNAEQNLRVHLDANDVDSYDGDGSVWYDISEHDVTIPLSDNADNLKVHYNPSNTDSYGGTGTTMSNLAGSSLDATVVASRFDIDNGGFFDVSTDGEATIAVPTGHPLNGTNFTLEFWFNWKSSPSAANRFIYKANTGWNFFYYGSLGWRINNADCATGYFSNGNYITVGQWYHCVIAQDSSNCKIYFDGELVKTQSVTSGTRSLGAFNFGSTAITADKPKCEIGAIRMYDKTLSASEVGQNYRHGRDYIYTDLAGTPFLHYDPADSGSYSGTGTTLTDLAGNNNADLLGGIESGWDEELGNSFPITGSGDGITTSSTVSVNPATDGMTVEMWFKMSSDTQNYLFSFDGSQTTYYGLSYRSNFDKVVFFYRTGASSLSNIYTPTVTLNKWHHLVATTDGSGAQIYLDGVAGDTTTNNAYSYNYNEDLHFGNLYDLAQNNNTDIGQIRFYKGHLTADQVMQNYLFTKNNYPNGFNATLQNGASWNSGGYMVLDGANDKISIPDNDVFSLDAQAKTSFSVWFKDTENSSSYRVLFSKGGSNKWEYAMFMYFSGSNRGIGFTSYNNGGSSIDARNYSSSNTWLSTNTWHHLVVTVDFAAEVCKVYIDGTERASDNDFVYSAYTNTDPFIFGGRADLTSNFFQGHINNFKLYDKVLTQTEITALNTAGYQG